MKKFLFAALIGILFITSIACTVFAQTDEIFVYLDAVKVEFDVKPQLINDRTMVPIRAIFESMGADVQWDEATDTAICTKDETVVKMTIDSTTMYIDDQEIKMDVSPVIIDGRTLAPARYVAEAFGADVQWSEKNNTVVICSQDVYAYADYPDIPDLGRCYNTPLVLDSYQDGYRIFAYYYSDMSGDELSRSLYDYSASVLGGYQEELLGNDGTAVYMQYTKETETEPRYYVAETYDEEGVLIICVMIPEEAPEEAEGTL